MSTLVVVVVLVLASWDVTSVLSRVRVSDAAAAAPPLRAGKKATNVGALAQQLQAQVISEWSPGTWRKEANARAGQK